VAAGAPATSSSAGSLHAAAGSTGPAAAASGVGQQSEHASPDASSDLQQKARPASGAPAATPGAGHTTAPAATASARAGVKSAAVAQPYLIYDSLVPSGLPTGHVVATYADGPGGVSPAAMAGRGPVLWIDVNATDPAANALDIEPGNATPSAAPTWVSSRLTAYPGALAILYTSISEWPAVQAAVATLPADMRARIRWWIADPTGYEHLVPGSDATQWYWGSSYDISTALPRFLALV
jgi:hypothetical protein